MCYNASANIDGGCHGDNSEFTPEQTGSIPVSSTIYWQKKKSL